MGNGSERLWEVIGTYTEAVRKVRELDTMFDLDEPQETIDAKNAIDWLDIGLVAPHFHARALLTYTPDKANSPGVTALFDDLERLDAIIRAEEVVSVVETAGFAAAAQPTEALAAELRQWAEASLLTPEVQVSLAAYNANPIPFNLHRLTP